MSKKSFFNIHLRADVGISPYNSVIFGCIGVLRAPERRPYNLRYTVIACRGGVPPPAFVSVKTGFIDKLRSGGYYPPLLFVKEVFFIIHWRADVGISPLQFGDFQSNRELTGEHCSPLQFVSCYIFSIRPRKRTQIIPNS